MKKSLRPLYRTWTSIKQRCFNKNNQSFKNYGGRGIDMAPEWIHNYLLFEEYVLSAIGPRPLKHTIDRIDNNRGYYPGNLKWSTNTEQGWNRRTNIWDESRLEELDILIRCDIPLKKDNATARDTLRKYKDSITLDMDDI